LEKYQAENGEAERVRLDLPDKAAWKAVLDVANDAENKYRTTTAKGVNGALHCFCRKLGDSGDTLLQWLKLLPDGDYTSILCGGLKMIIQAAVKTSELRETIFKTIRQIPEIIKDAMFHFDLYTSLVLHERVSDLYSTILNTLRGIVEWYNRRPSGRSMTSTGRLLSDNPQAASYGLCGKGAKPSWVALLMVRRLKKALRGSKLGRRQ
jgi:hypothetical protein